MSTVSRTSPTVAVVTGAARRIGRAVALSLAGRGMTVVVHFGSSADNAAQVVNEIRSAGGTAIAIDADLRDPEAAARRVFGAAATLGPASVLINSAAVFEDQPLAMVQSEHCQRHLNVNLLAPVFLTQEFACQLPADETGHVINLLDWRAGRPKSTHLIYTASKAALWSVTQVLAQQLAPRIRVNGIAAGAILPPEDNPERHKQRAVESVPLRQTGSPRDICDAINFLLSSRFITGEVIHVSGGEEL